MDITKKVCKFRLNKPGLNVINILLVYIFRNILPQPWTMKNNFKGGYIKGKKTTTPPPPHHHRNDYISSHFQATYEAEF